MQIIKRSGWRKWANGLVLVTCPKCNTSLNLDPNHTITGDGTVKPSLGCPIKKCDYHEWVKLEGWPGDNEDDK